MRNQRGVWLKAALAIMVVFMSAAALIVFLLPWENRGPAILRIPYGKLPFSKESNMEFLRGYFAGNGLLPVKGTTTPSLALDSIQRAGVITSEDKLVEAYRSSATSHYASSAHLFDYPDRQEFVLVIYGPGRLTMWDARQYRSTWRRLVAEFYHAWIRRSARAEETAPFTP